MIKPVIIAATLILTASTIPASATLYSSTDRMNVTYGDLDLSKSKGQKVLYQRLKRAAKNVCEVGSFNKTKSLVDMTRGRVCYKESLTAAVNEINNQGLKELHDS